MESYHKLQARPKTVSKFKDALQLIWSVLPQKATDNAVKDHRKLLRACVSANYRHFEKVGICLGNNQGNFQLHRFTISKNIAKSFRGRLV